METTKPTSITIETTVKAPIEKVWDFWAAPKHIQEWCNPSDDWHAPYAENNLHPGGTFKTTMAARDGSTSFDFGGVYDTVVPHELIEYTLGDGRKVSTHFTPAGDEVKIVQTFDAENENPIEMQRGGWQAILDNFKKHTEAN